MTDSALFSIDVDAHLQKAATHTFSSPAHYPVELVRAALRRGATQVDINVSGNRIRVTDNGGGLDNDALTTLDAIMAGGHSTEVKEEAVERVQKPENFGLLALFAASPTLIDIGNVRGMEKCRIRFQNRTMNRSGDTALSEGTDIVIFPGKHNRDPNREKEILTAYCNPVTVPVRLNGKRISSGTLLTHQLATVKVPARQGLKQGVIGIPQGGDLCRIRLLDCRIPYRYVTVPAYKGFIFDAAIEYRGEITRGLLDHLAESSYRLYMWLCGQHRGAETNIRDRIEELMFAHYRLTSDQSFLHHFSPFKEYRAETYYSLPELSADGPRHSGHSAKGEPAATSLQTTEQTPRSHSPRRSLFAVPRNKEKLRYAVGSRRVLSLTREQADFLINMRHIPITFLSPVFHREKRLPGMVFRLKRVLKGLISSLLPTPSPKSCPAYRDLAPMEQAFIDRLNRCLNTDGADNNQTVTAVMVNASGPFVALSSQTPHTSGTGDNGIGQANPEGIRRIFIRRHHPTIKKIVRAVQTNPDNIELLIPLLPL